MAMKERTILVAPKSRAIDPSVCARNAARFPLARTTSSVLARHWGVSPSRARHLRTTEPTNPASAYLSLIEDPDVRNGPDYVVSALEALERRYIREAQTHPARMRARLDHLMSQEHTVESHQNRALQSGQGVNAALLDHAATLVEIVAIRRALGMEDS